MPVRLVMRTEVTKSATTWPRGASLLDPTLPSPKPQGPKERQEGILPRIITRARSSPFWGILKTRRRGTLERTQQDVTKQTGAEGWEQSNTTPDRFYLFLSGSKSRVHQIYTHKRQGSAIVTPLLACLLLHTPYLLGEMKGMQSSSTRKTSA